MNIISILAICLVLFLVVIYLFKKKKNTSTHNIMSNEEIIEKFPGSNVSKYCLKLIREYKSV